MKVQKPGRMFEIAERNFNAAYADILEMPIFDFLKYWIYRAL